MKHTVETWTCKVLRELANRDDFLTAKRIREAVGGNPNQISAALIHLRKRKAIDCIVEPDGVAWWFATPDSDDRTSHVDERKPETKPRNRKKGFPRRKKA